MTGALDRRGEAWARSLFRGEGLSCYLPFRDKGVDIVVTDKMYGTGKQVEVQVKYSEVVYSQDGKGHYSFNLLPEALGKYQGENTCFLFLAVPLSFSEVRDNEHRNILRKRMMTEARYIIPISEVKRLMTVAGPQDRLGIDENGHPMLGTRRIDKVDWTVFEFNRGLDWILQRVRKSD